MLKPQDLQIVLKLCVWPEDRGITYDLLAAELGMTKSEVHAGVRRAVASRLLRMADGRPVPLLDAVREFVESGAPYAFPAMRGEVSRGVPTSVGATPLSGTLNVGNQPPPVWPSADGKARGPSISPIYPSVPHAAVHDSKLYELLALFDAIRDGRARQRQAARKLLGERLTG